MPEAVIQARDVTFSFGPRAVIDRLDFEVRAGEVFGYIGHNGAGKTTTVRLLNGLLSPDRGELRVLGLSPTADGAELRARAGVLTEAPSLDERLTARENLRYFAELYGVPRRSVEARIDELLASFQLEDQADAKARTFSKGLKQRLALARALLHSPEVLYLDEPTSALDPIAAHHVHELVLGLRAQGRTVFLCTHNLHEAQRLCDRIAVLERGKLLAMGTPAELARGLGGDQVELDFALDDLPRALELLGANPDVSEAKQEGSLLLARAGREALPALAASLTAAGIRLYRMSPRQVSLEDAYFALHRGEAA